MNKVKSLSQQNLSLLLAIYIGIFLNLSVFYRRFDSFSHGIQGIKVISAVTEVIAIVLFTFFIMRLVSLGGRLFYRIAASLLVLISVAASYYMTFFNVVIGYGIVVSVMTTDVDLSKEVVGMHFVLWMVVLSALPLLCIWKNNLRYTLIEQLKTPGHRIKPLVVLVAVVALVWVPLRMLDNEQSAQEKITNVDLPSYGGVVAHSYLPSNWLSALGLFAYTRYDESQDHANLFDPAKNFTYVAPADIDDTYVVFIIGETTRWDHMGILGYDRDTTPRLSKEKNLVAFRGTSCDTATKLSLRCMFVREGGTADNPQRTLKEQNVFAVMKDLGFTSELFAMQSEVWFYNNTEVNNYSFREMIASEKRNDGKSVDDMLLVDEMKESLARYPKGKHLVILHTKGSHYLYSQRYPRSYARYQPECIGVDDFCSKDQLVNAFDNSVLYTDSFIANVIDQVREKKAIVFYSSDHGESIGENSHLHGTPREMAPVEQFRVPMMVWASDKFLEDPQHRSAFEQLQAQQRVGKTHRHVELFDTILGCLGYTSPNGGIVAKNNWCNIPQEKAAPAEL
ncbi:Phosphoethanolamine transferase eptB [Serratia quinivorans]|uniref:kdo(2)-lipid A phosphoethanolamine 7''-transferase n=1 Tax=Serratia quinivorans TaxID=137545 RepID=UPI00217C8201|nr:kdo(2)-lipid A phosphoethanolamine 7''-transferase [Serratia quinivorans]CAI1897289.1 Phosphoethanolamine transferase eptB [Serratia quinivorans]CAI1990090.1 Phosphoethanolamine transferase eptB [Serratia quinivorans]CAI2138949.1 Phosphoethanolamine transferase eptB [Serratia quinivorans]CAI2146437.1 Phosphoethanolamine transferase eptB [Serratia quinivorans]CAI2397966.1 Phosphoethanolamine transferase eptB [Serratia quinivorans]